MRAHGHRRSHFAFSIGLSPKAKGQMLSGIETAFLPSLKEEYPPSGYDVYETDETCQVWKEYRDATLYPDRRGEKTWKPFHKLDAGCLQYTIKQDESIIIQDSKTEEIVYMAIWNFSGNKGGILEWVKNIIEENTAIRKSVRVSPFHKHYSSLSFIYILAGGLWEVVPDWLYFWCSEQSSAGMGSESARKTHWGSCQSVDVQLQFSLCTVLGHHPKPTTWRN